MFAIDRTQARPTLCVVALLVAISLLSACASFIVGGAAQGGNPDYRADQTLAESVERYLAADPEIGNFSIRATVYQGTATLSGRVATARQSQRATDLAYRVAGVKRVVSRISYAGF